MDTRTSLSKISFKVLLFSLYFGFFLTPQDLYQTVDLDLCDERIKRAFDATPAVVKLEAAKVSKLKVCSDYSSFTNYRIHTHF